MAGRMKLEVVKQAELQEEFDQDQYFKDLEVLQQAHQILLRRTDDGQKKQEIQNSNADVKATKTFSNFVNFTSVREMFDEIQKQLDKQVPLMQDKIKNNHLNILELQSKNNAHQHSIEQLQEQQKEIFQIKVNHDSLCKNVEMESQKIVVNYEKGENDYQKLKLDIQRVHDLIQKITQKNNRQDSKIDQSFLSIDKQRAIMQERFDEWFANIGAEQKRMQKQIIDLQQQQASVVEQVKEFNDQAKTSMDQTINNLFKKFHTNQKQFEKFDTKLKKFDKQMIPMTGILSTLEDLKSQKSMVQQHSNFLSENLPTYMHLTVCEALDKVVGKEHKKQLIEFEKSKIKDLVQFRARKPGLKGLVSLGNKLGNLLKSFSEYNQGVMPVNYNRVRWGPNDPEEENQVEKSTINDLTKRYESFLNDESLLKDASDLAFGNPIKISPTLLKHKINKLKDWQINKLRNSIANRRVIEFENFDDFMINNPKKDAQFNQNYEAPSIQTHINKNFQQFNQRSPQQQIQKRKMSNIHQFGQDTVIQQGSPSTNHGQQKTEDLSHIISHQGPTKLYLIQSEQSRPYYRLNRKFSDLFTTAIDQFSEFKASSLENMAKSVQMSLELSNDLKMIKDVISELQTQLEESDFRLRSGINEQEERITDMIKSSEARAKHINHNNVKMLEKDIKRIETDLLQHEQKADELTQSQEDTQKQNNQIFDQLEQQLLSMQENLEISKQEIQDVLKVQKELEAKVQENENKQQKQPNVNILDQFKTQMNQKINTKINEAREKEERDTQKVLIQELTPKILSLVEDRVATALAEKFMTIQKRVDDHAVQLQSLMVNLASKNEEALQIFKNQNEKYHQEQSEQVQIQEKKLAQNMIKMQTKMALQGHYLAAKTKLIQKKENQIDEQLKLTLEKVDQVQKTMDHKVTINTDISQEKYYEDFETQNSQISQLRISGADQTSQVSQTQKLNPSALTNDKSPNKNQNDSSKVHPNKQKGAILNRGGQTSTTNHLQEDKLKQKLEKQKKLEEKKKKEKQRLARQKEREERQAEMQRLREEEERELAKAAERAEKKQKEDEEIKAKYAQKLSEMQKMFSTTRTAKMGQQFLYQLGAQKGNSLVDDNKLQLRQHYSCQKNVDGGNMLTGQKGRDGTKVQFHSRQSTMKPDRKKQSILNSEADPNENKSQNEMYQSQDENVNDFEEESSQEGFINPFAINNQNNAGISPEKFEKMLKPRIEELQILFKSELKSIYTKIDKIQGQQREILEIEINNTNQQLKDINKNIDKIQFDFQMSQQQTQKFESLINSEMEELKTRLHQETQEIIKMKKGVKNDIQLEIRKISSDDDYNKYQLRRINSILSNLGSITELVVQDLMLGQLLIEQESLDKKQIGLFALKKNQQILGTNQYAMQNNLMNISQMAQSDNQKGAETMEDTLKTQSKTFWDLRNKNKKYNDVVKGPVITGQNIRGADSKFQTINDRMYQSGRSESPDNQNINPEPRVLNSGLSDQIFSGENTKRNEQYLNDSFIERYNNIPNYNTIFLDRNCVSCQQGSATTTLALLKVACLNYVSSPIRYGPIPPQPFDINQLINREQQDGVLSQQLSKKFKQQLLSNINSPSSTACQSIQRVGQHSFVDLKVQEVIQLKEGIIKQAQDLLKQRQYQMINMPQNPNMFAKYSHQVPSTGQTQQKFQVHLTQDIAKDNSLPPRFSSSAECRQNERIDGHEPNSSKNVMMFGNGATYTVGRQQSRDEVVKINSKNESGDDLDDVNCGRDSVEIKRIGVKIDGPVQSMDTKYLDSPNEIDGRNNLQMLFDQGPSSIELQNQIRQDGQFANQAKYQTMQFQNSNLDTEELLNNNSSNHPKFQIKVLQDLIKWRQNSRQTQSVQTFIQEMLQKERRKALRQTELQNNLIIKQNALEHRKELDRKQRNSSFISSEIETKISTTINKQMGQGLAKTVKGRGRCRSKDGQSFKKMHGNDTDLSDKTELLNDPSLSQAYLNTIISSSQQIKVGHLKQVIGSTGNYNAKVLRSSVNVGVAAPSGSKSYGAQNLMPQTVSVTLGVKKANPEYRRSAFTSNQAARMRTQTATQSIHTAGAIEKAARTTKNASVTQNLEIPSVIPHQKAIMTPMGFSQASYL